LVLKLKTNEIGYFTYYGEFGATLGLKTKSTVDDDSKLFTWNSNDSTFIESQPFTTTLENINIDKGTQTVRLGLTLGAGAEYSLSGSTALFFQLNWNYFINNQLVSKEKEEFLRQEVSNGIFESVGAKSFPGNIVLSFGILF
jgi:opacity protein-like surface antigen